MNCRFYQAGNCRNGDNCRFIHDNNNASSAPYYGSKTEQREITREVINAQDEDVGGASSEKSNGVFRVPCVQGKPHHWGKDCKKCCKRAKDWIDWDGRCPLCCPYKSLIEVRISPDPSHKGRRFVNLKCHVSRINFEKAEYSDEDEDGDENEDGDEDEENTGSDSEAESSDGISEFMAAFVDYDYVCTQKFDDVEELLDHVFKDHLNDIEDICDGMTVCGDCSKKYYNALYPRGSDSDSSDFGFDGRVYYKHNGYRFYSDGDCEYDDYGIDDYDYCYGF